MRLTLAASLVFLAATAAGQTATPAPDAPSFGPAERLTFGGSKLDDLYYPTPVLQNVDDDPEREIVIGDLTGKLYVVQPGSGNDDTVWPARIPVNGADGKPLKLNNW